MNNSEFKIKIFADGANLDDIERLNSFSFVKGFTTNPSLMRAAGVIDYTAFAQEALNIVPDKPFSFEVFADDFFEMEDQAREIASWGTNVYVKIPIMNTKGESACEVIRSLSESGIPLNITALFTLDQIKELLQHLHPSSQSIISIFAGRIADTGRDPIPTIQQGLELLHDHPNSELLWASPRELLNIVQAEQIGCHIITLPSSLLDKISLFGKDLTLFSQETVQMFYRDACDSNFSIACNSLPI